MSVKLRFDQIQDRDRFEILKASTPHKSPRGTTRPRVVLIHATVSTNPEGTLSWFENPESQVSSDFVIGKTGAIWRPVPKGHYAWHAGKCLYNGTVRSDYNRISYGIELVNKNNGLDPYPVEQLRAMAFVIAQIKLESPSVSYLRRHADVAYPRGRKSDPKGLSISDIYGAVEAFQNAVWIE